MLSSLPSTVLLLALGHPVSPGPERQTLTDDVVADSEEASFVLDDLENFLWAMECVESGQGLEDALQQEYLDAASPGLVMYIQKYGLTVDRLVAAMEKYPESYARLPETAAVLRQHLPVFRQAYGAMAELIPGAVFPPTYFLVAGHRGIGSGTVEGPVLSVEKETQASIEEDLVATVVHEMVHMQQLARIEERYFEIFQGEARTLLALSIREGVATYFAEILVGGSEHKNVARDYLLSREAELWKRFRREMLGTKTGDWLWSSPKEPGLPQDLGYALGARIAEAYHQLHGRSSQAVIEILSVTDYPAFLERSGYGQDLEE